MIEIAKVLIVVGFFAAIMAPLYFFYRYLDRAREHVRGQSIFTLNVRRLREPEFYGNLVKALLALAVTVAFFALLIEFSS